MMSAYRNRHIDPRTGKLSKQLIMVISTGETWLLASTALFTLFATSEAWTVAILCLPLSLCGAFYIRRADAMRADMIRQAEDAGIPVRRIER